MKRIFGLVEVVFDISYLGFVFLFACILFGVRAAGGISILAGCMALVLFFGDACHLIPRIRGIIAQDNRSFLYALGRGKQITSITMTVFYVLLWQLVLLLFSLDQSMLFYVSALIYVLASLRIILCLLPQNEWIKSDVDTGGKVNVSVDWNVDLHSYWNILRNIPFFMIGAIVAVLFFANRQEMLAVRWMWLAILLSFLFYVPVVIWSNKKPALGMLMLPKSCMYLWMLGICLSLKS